MSVTVNSPVAPLHGQSQESRSHSTKHGDRHHRSEKKRKRNRETLDDDQQPSKKSRPLANNENQQLQPKSPTNSTLDSPFYKHTSSLYLPISPVTQLFALEGLCAEHLSPLLLTYHRPFGGVVLSYSNPRLSENPTPSPTKTTVLAKAVDAYAMSFIWLTADFLVFKPKRGQVIEGWINLQNESHLGLVCWNLFNASIERRRLPRDWKWSGIGGRMSGGRREGDGEGAGGAVEKEAREERGQGYFVDGMGRKVEGLIRFKVRDAETAYSYGKGFLTIEGTMLVDEEE